MAALTSAPLNAEPTAPDECQKEHLPPKSYADAVEEEPPVNGTNGTADTNGKKSTESNGTKDGEGKHMASVLRIVDTGAPDTKENEKERPQAERKESKQEYSATVCFPAFARIKMHADHQEGTR